MSQMKEVYNLKNDYRQIRMIQEASLDKKSFAGYKVENDLLFGTREWFTAIEKGEIKSHIIKGTITKVMMAGHGDFPEFEIKNQEGVSIWTREGDNRDYVAGSNVELTYVEQKYKRPSDITGSISKCVLKIEIGK